jgi:hypothetical protein
MSDTRRLLEAANALSQLLRQHSIAHAFHGSIFTAVLSDNPRCDVRHLSSVRRPHTDVAPGNILYRRRRLYAPVPPGEASRRWK